MNINDDSNQIDDEEQEDLSLENSSLTKSLDKQQIRDAKINDAIKDKDQDTGNFPNSNLSKEELENISPAMISKANILCSMGRIGDAYNHLFDAQQDFFHQQIKKSKRASAPGPSGWTSDLIKQLCNQFPPFLKLLYEFFLAMIKSDFYPKYIFIGSVIALHKINKVDPRPITIPEAFDKLLSRIILKLESQAYQKGIPDTQYGVGQRWGGEKIIAIIQTVIDLHAIAYNQNPDSELYIIQTDISGAFNSVK
ncbi:MAG: hypothetical protein EZS28_022985 [Streblomastix strix]|uniref:Reverse transcriptase domain-containing protein n=1 Tax=Streblomastix strix TaxID=222440 RepID=A0A5J4VFY2_9EUKA|nr:MAG: hypothetical protein EZS28_022985 [Streblomastix strix]